jgi:catechol 2,3-dioxygenase-like lactoylglutathione lyase family enzyme
MQVSSRPPREGGGESENHDDVSRASGSGEQRVLRGPPRAVAHNPRARAAGRGFGAVRWLGRAHLAVAEIGLYDHIDLRVRDLRKLRPFYDALMRALGVGVARGGNRSREYYQKDRRLPFFGLSQSAKHVPGLSRVAFGAATRKDVDRIAAVARRAGAKAISGPEVCVSYRQPYYAVFFEDPEGNRFEVCCRR